MSGVKSVKELKEVVLFPVKVVNGVQAALKDDGKIGLSDAHILFGLIQPLIEVVQGVGEIPAEIADFQTEEAVEILAAVSAELVVDNEKAKKIVLASLDLVSSSVPKVAALVEAIKS